MKIAHLTVVRKLSQGQEKQLGFEHEASRRLPGSNWTTMALHCDVETRPFVRQIPKAFRPVFLRNLYGWIVALRLSRENDVVLLRHMTFDPFAFAFAGFLKNRISVHHSKEIGELRLVRKGWPGRLASNLEVLSGRYALTQTVAIAGVTNEISEYELRRAGLKRPVTSYPNAINVSLVSPLEDRRSADQIEIAFICGTFKPWHGLERLIDAVSGSHLDQNKRHFKIHLIGTLNEEQQRNVQKDVSCRQAFVVHGPMKEEQYRMILERCHVGLSSFALDLQDLTEAATLKVREMLAMGLPVYACHKDTSLSADFPYFLNDQTLSMNGLLSFAHRMRQVPRLTVRSTAEPFIDKLGAMERMVAFCKECLSLPLSKNND